jgi:hypothetical protein
MLRTYTEHTAWTKLAVGPGFRNGVVTMSVAQRTRVRAGHRQGLFDTRHHD